jgi:putative acyl-CoA dehydrogenase
MATQHASPPIAPSGTHEVLNQAPPLEGLDVFGSHTALVEATEREGAEWILPRAAELGPLIGGEPQAWGVQANENPPRLRTHDRFGHRIDEVEFHPAWHRLMELGVAWELHALPWRDPRPGAHTARAALYMRPCRPRPASPVRSR